MSRRQTWLPWLTALSAGLVFSTAGCVADGANGGGKGDRPASDTQLRGSKTSLSRASSCDDLLKKIQNDAIAKLDLSIERAKQRWQDQSERGGAETDWPSSGHDDGANFGGGTVGIAVTGTATGPTLPGTSDPIATPPSATSAGAPSGQAPDSNAAPLPGGGVSADPIGALNPEVEAPRDSDRNAANGAVGKGDAPTGSSETNTQVAGVDEADFIKVVDNGRAMFLLHGNALRKLKTFPAEQLSLAPSQLKIEGNPSELFVTKDGRAVIFSSVYGYPSFGGASGGADAPVDVACEFGKCGGGSYPYGGSLTKVTIADVSGDTPKAVRELYYQGNYVSSRRYDDIVRVVLQSERSFDNLYEPQVDGYDPWGRPYDADLIDAQLEQWRDRIAGSVRNTKLSDWVPAAKELKSGALVEVAPDCDSYFVPQPGFSDSGLVQVLSIDAAKNDAPVGGVTVMGRASTVYSSLDRLVLAQPDYRWLSDSGGGDFGFIDQQRTTLHAFALAGDQTTYLASGWVPGQLPQQNQQFGLDETDAHTLRVVTSGQRRARPEASPRSPEFWQTETENLVSTLHEVGNELKVVGKSDPLGHAGETVQSARFVGDRAYVVTFRQTDPLIVLDVSKDAEPMVIGEIEIPGFGQYVHPLDEDHLITFGRSGNNGSQLQLFDVSDPLHIPAPKSLDFGSGSSSETAFNHKAFTYYAPLGLIALPVTANRLSNGLYTYSAALRVIKVDAKKGFELLGSIDHSGFADSASGCFSCGPWGCKQYCYAGSPEVRRGHFVESGDASYVYAIGYGGVTVNTLADLATPLAKLKLPALMNGDGPWYASGGGARSSGGSIGAPVAVSPPSIGSAPTPAMTTGSTATSTKPTLEPTTVPVDAGSSSGQRDAGSASVQDGGVAAVQDAG